MPTGPLHEKTVRIVEDDDGSIVEQETEPCRCVIGSDHTADGVTYEYRDSETLSVYDAALIWGSNGMDEDCTFGYSEDELRGAL
ncbi:MAG: hypothetical protein EGS39_02040 [Bifidobacterium bifidum]|uniref:hypothetical protein n=1 Tax=Bifidobacterium bifidum TaxID=1681 RepID=UPI001C23EC49|nr:hypothetical protein [Bifidobacterium bifidum]MBD9264805.1 hypothetical protein [Bifidobacterium bifidum]MBU8983093.1 hypothetical protein [Bifidobacterium bifidum]MBU8986639.1 hypothetical protein [Bifidobacterium bifidum]